MDRRFIADSSTENNLNINNVIRLEENKARAQELEEEKQMYNEQASELQATIHDLTLQKEMTEAELKVTSEIADPWDFFVWDCKSLGS